MSVKTVCVHSGAWPLSKYQLKGDTEIVVVTCIRRKLPLSAGGQEGENVQQRVTP